MAIIVEDGSGLTNADAYVSVADADAYIAKVSGSASWTAASTSAKELAIRQGTAYLDNRYRSRWRGRRMHDTQALAWPRAYAVDDDGYGVESDIVPSKVKDATAEAALRALAGTLMADLTNPGTVSRTRKKVGPLETETEYVGGNSPVPVYRVIDALLKSLITPSQADRG